MIQAIYQDSPMLFVQQTRNFNAIQGGVDPEEVLSVGLDSNALRGMYAAGDERLNFGAIQSGPHNRRGVCLGPVDSVSGSVVGNVSRNGRDVDWY